MIKTEIAITSIDARVHAIISDPKWAESLCATDIVAAMIYAQQFSRNPSCSAIDFCYLVAENFFEAKARRDEELKKKK